MSFARRLQNRRGEATKGYNLPAQYVIHTVGPVWRGGDNEEERLLASCYRKALEVANGLKVKSIAFPAISTGKHEFGRNSASPPILRRSEEAANIKLENPHRAKVVRSYYVMRTCRITLDLYAQAGMPNKRLAQSKLVRTVLNKAEALA